MKRYRQNVLVDTIREMILAEGVVSTKDISLYTYVSRSLIESVMHYGLAGTKGIIDNKEILDSMYEDDDEKQAFIDRYDDSDMTLHGPSVFFQRPDIDKIIEIDPEHILGTGEYILLSISYEELIAHPGYQGIYGVELEPYDDEEYDDRKLEVEHIVSESDIAGLAGIGFEEAWHDYVPGYFAANVAHGIVLTESGLIDPELLEIVK